MKNYIYIVEEFNCRGDVGTNKYKFDCKELKSFLNKMLKEQKENEEIGEYSKELVLEIENFMEANGYPKYGDILYELLSREFDENEDLHQRVNSLEKGLSIMLEEVSIGVGSTKKEALAKLIELDLEEDW